MQIPFFQKIPQGQRYLLAGCGGGYDIITVIPLYSEFNLNQYSVASSLMYWVYTAVAVALS